MYNDIVDLEQPDIEGFMNENCDRKFGYKDHSLTTPSKLKERLGNTFVTV